MTTSTRTTYHTNNQTYRIDVVSVGRSFGCVGQVYDRTGRRLLAQTVVTPHGMRDVARQRAFAIADTLG